ncbi:hypothetical protein [Photorhabdus khanii]|uniref:hypothetical protein n=1 Tax=Photorhabdus khanii TaxID=1004150 RepID=UPI0030DA3212
MKKLPIRVLISLLEQELIRMGYKETTLNYYCEHWKRIATYFDEHHENFFPSVSRCNMWLKNATFLPKKRRDY